MENKKVILAKDIVQHTNTILEDMYLHKAEYSAKDLAWRCLDMNRAMLKAISALVDVFAEAGEEVSKELDTSPEAVLTLLQLCGLEKVPSKSTIAKWNDSTREEVATWAAAVHLEASDNDVEIPSVPKVLSRWVKESVPDDEDDVDVED